MIHEKKPRFIAYGKMIEWKQIAVNPINHYFRRENNSAIHVYLIRNSNYAHVVVKTGCITLSDLPF